MQFPALQFFFLRRSFLLQVMPALLTTVRGLKGRVAVWRAPRFSPRGSFRGAFGVLAVAQGAILWLVSAPSRRLLRRLGASLKFEDLAGRDRSERASTIESPSE